MTSGTSKGVAVALLVVLIAAGGVVGFVIGKRNVVTVSPSGRAAPAQIDRFSRRLNLSPEQRESVSKILDRTKATVQKAQSSGQSEILALLDDEQKVLYRKMLERRKKRIEKRRKRRGKRGKKRRRDREENR